MSEITDANIVEIIEKAIDRSKWEKFKFSDLFENVVEKVVPKNSGLEHYIGLEHLDSGSLHIKRFGDTSSLIGDKLKIYKGDIIFAKRNAYLKRASIAPFDAIASAHSLVLRPKEKNVLPEFIPFFLMSKKFWERAIEISVGSLSPTINWKSLAKQEFLLPPKDQQAKLAELLWAIDEVIESEKRILINTLSYKNSLQKFLYLKDYPNRVRLSKYVKVIGGFAFSSTDFKNTGTPVIKIKNIVNGEIIIDAKENCINENDFSKIDKFRLSTDDILIAMTGATLGKIGVVQEEMNNSYLNQRVGKFELKTEVNKDCLYGIFDNNYFLLELKKYIGEGAQGNISSDDIAKCLVPKLSEKEMAKYGGIFKSIYSSYRILESSIQSSQSLQKSLINHVF